MDFFCSLDISNHSFTALKIHKANGYISKLNNWLKAELMVHACFPAKW